MSSTDDIATELYTVKMQVADLKNTKGELATKKRCAENELSEATSRIRLAGRLPEREYNGLVMKQNHAKNKIREVEKQMLAINNSLRILFAKEDELRVRAGANGMHLSLQMNGQSDVCDTGPLVTAIRELQSKYLDFAEDSTRINSMRLMAGTFANELTGLLRKTGNAA